MSKIVIIMGSESDRHVADRAEAILKEYPVDFETHVASAHRNPERVKELATSPADVFICIAGLSAALPGVVASHTKRPVIGVPVSGKINLDSILSVIQMPKGVPVAAVGLDRGDNAALLALRIVGLFEAPVRAKLEG
ncbi:MAG TPA: 5-(carboxyamino)imidazole ribonucleotide mutase [Euryarchaeota archaeon]|nr:5-(carboxyamino)imidazole ribonucleotide mutase [Euryarchaeota archaeon]